MAGSCPFCVPDPDRLIRRDELVSLLWDKYPLNPGHALIVPNRHVASWFEASTEERAALMRGVEACKADIEKIHRVDGYNVGFNDGAAAKMLMLSSVVKISE